MDGDEKRAKRILSRIKKERDAVSARLERIDFETSKSEINETKKTIESIEKELKDWISKEGLEPSERQIIAMNPFRGIPFSQSRCGAPFSCQRKFWHTIRY